MDSHLITLRIMFSQLQVEQLLAIFSGSMQEEDVFVDNAKWTERQYTISQLEHLYSQMCGANNRLPIFDVALEFAMECLDTTGLAPRIKLHQILRWKQVTKYLGEDLFTTILLQKIGSSPGAPIDFAWPDAVDVSAASFNRWLDGGIADIHAHLHAAANVSDLSWIMMMNNPDIANEFKIKSFSGCTQSTASTHEFEFKFELNELVAIAAYIRMHLYHRMSGCAETYNLPNNLLKNIIGWYKGWGVDKSAKKNLESLIEGERHEALALTVDTNICFDYLLNEKWVGGLPNKTSPYALLAGERKFLYYAFKECLREHPDGQQLAMQKMLHLYLLIKSSLRKRYVHLNNLHGLENFMEIDAKGVLPRQVRLRYAVQSGMRPGKPDLLEARFNASECHWNYDWEKPLLSGGAEYNKATIRKGLSYVLPLNKTFEQYAGYESRCQEALRRARQIIDSVRRSKAEGKYRITGVDTLGRELNVRPELFRRAYKEIHDNNIPVTYHCGEDFYDLVDGLRAIDEAITYLDLREGDRIGHALALGIDAKSYYKSRNYFSPLPIRIAIDNIAWLYSKMAQVARTGKLKPAKVVQLMAYLQGEFDSYQRALKDLGPVKFTIDHYIKSMSHRGLDKDSVEAGLDADLYKAYTDCYEGPSAYIHWRHDIPLLVKQIQGILNEEILSKKIAVENCPSSNLAIGPIERYDQLPLFSLKPAHARGKKSLPVSVSTDDRGVFTTSLTQEIALIATALSKANSKASVENYIKSLISAARSHVFK